MSRKILYSVIAAVLLLTLNFAGKAHFRRRNAIKAVESLLTHWENNDPILAMAYWEKETDSPPIYGLLDHEIGNKEFYKEDGLYRARVDVKLYFSAGNHFPSGREWALTLKKTRYNWKVSSLQIQN